MAATPSLILEILEAAFSCDDERALRLAEEAGCSRFDLSMLRCHMPEDEADEGGYFDGYIQGGMEGERAARRRLIAQLKDGGHLTAVQYLATRYMQEHGAEVAS